jgi:uncharacterized membrane protein YdfJ with MMPL/SSD domain
VTDADNNNEGHISWATMRQIAIAVAGAVVTSFLTTTYANAISSAEVRQIQVEHTRQIAALQMEIERQRETNASQSVLMATSQTQITQALELLKDMNAKVDALYRSANGR